MRGVEGEVWRGQDENSQGETGGRSDEQPTKGYSGGEIGITIDERGGRRRTTPVRRLGRVDTSWKEEPGPGPLRG